MKKILFFILIAVSLNGIAQFPMTQGMATANTRLQVNGAVDAMKGLINGVYADTAAANADQIDFYDGAQIWTTSDRNFWLRSTVLNMWIRMAKFSDVSGVYTASNGLTMTANNTKLGGSLIDATTTLTMGGNIFQMTSSGGGQFLVSPTAGRYRLGDYAGNVNGWNLDINDVTQYANIGAQSGTQIHIGDDDDLFTVKIAGSTYLSLHDGDFYQIGDIDGGTGNETKLVINDAGPAWTATNIPAGAGTSALRYNPATGAITYGDTTAGGGGGEANTASNVGSGAGVFKQKTGVDLELRSLVASDGISIVENANDITITATTGINNNDSWYQYIMDISGASNAHMYIGNNGAGASQTRLGTPPADNWLMGLELTTGTTSGGFSWMHAGNSGVVSGVAINNSYRYSFATKLRLEDLSDGTETFSVFAGFGDHAHDVPTFIDGVWFDYTHSASSGQWVCNTRSNSSTTSTASGVTVAADTDYLLEITIIGGSAYFYINKSLVHTETLTIPTGVARSTGIATAIKKSAGTTSRKLYYELLKYGKSDN